MNKKNVNLAERNKRNENWDGNKFPIDKIEIKINGKNSQRPLKASQQYQKP